MTTLTHTQLAEIEARANADAIRKEQLRIQALGAAISRRDWHAAETAYSAIRDAFDSRPSDIQALLSHASALEAERDRLKAECENHMNFIRYVASNLDSIEDVATSAILYLRKIKKGRNG